MYIGACKGRSAVEPHDRPLFVTELITSSETRPGKPHPRCSDDHPTCDLTKVERCFQSLRQPQATELSPLAHRLI